MLDYRNFFSSIARWRLLIYLNLQRFQHAIKTKEDCQNLNTSKNNDEAYKNGNSAQNLHPIYLRTHLIAYSYSKFHKLDFNKISTIQTIQVLSEWRLWYYDNISIEHKWNLFWVTINNSNRSFQHVQVKKEQASLAYSSWNHCSNVEHSTDKVQIKLRGMYDI